MRWFDQLMTVLSGVDNDNVVGIVERPGLRYEQDWEDAIRYNKVWDRQREAYMKLRRQGKSLLVGYKPPEAFNSDRIEAQTHGKGLLTPTEEKQRKKPVAVTIGRERRTLNK